MNLESNISISVYEIHNILKLVHQNLIVIFEPTQLICQILYNNHYQTNTNLYLHCIFISNKYKENYISQNVFNLKYSNLMNKY